MAHEFIGLLQQTVKTAHQHLDLWLRQFAKIGNQPVAVRAGVRLISK